MDNGDHLSYGPMGLPVVPPSSLILHSALDDDAAMLESFYRNTWQNMGPGLGPAQCDFIKDQQPFPADTEMGTLLGDGLASFDIQAFPSIPGIVATMPNATPTQLLEQSFASRNSTVVHTNLADVIHTHGNFDSYASEMVESRAQSLMSPIRSRYPTSEDWDTYRSIFTQLYREENRTLSEVKAIMKDTYGFNATVKMYNKRIGDWQLFKNQKASEKEQVARHLEAHKKLGVDLGAPMIRGRQIEEHKITRHLKEKRKMKVKPPEWAPLVQDEPLSPSSTTPEDARPRKRARTQRSTSCHAISFSRVTDPIEYRNVENVLVQIDQYFASKLEGDPLSAWNTWSNSAESPNKVTRIRYTYQSRSYISTFTGPDDLYNQCCAAAIRLNRSRLRQEGWQMIHGGAEMIRPCLKQESPRLLQRFLTILDDSTMESHPGVLNLLLRLFTSMAACMYGKSHPISIMCHALQTSRNMKLIVSLAKKKLVDTLKHYLRKGHYNLLVLQMMFIRNGSAQGTFDEKKSAARRLVTNCESQRGPDDYLTRWALAELALMYDYRSSECQNILLDVLERGKIDARDDYISIRARQGLRANSFLHKDYVMAEWWQWEALSSSLYTDGPLLPITKNMSLLHILYLEELRANQKGSEGRAQYAEGPSNTSEPPVRSLSRRRANSLPGRYSLNCPCKDSSTGHAQTEGLSHQNPGGILQDFSRRNSTV